MSARCVLCGKSYAKKVTDPHLKSHKVSKKKYAAAVEALPEAAWEFYWTHPGLQVNFPNPASEKKGPGGALTFKQWCVKTGVIA